VVWRVRVWVVRVEERRAGAEAVRVYRALGRGSR
jgi:hypothetical protein